MSSPLFNTVRVDPIPGFIVFYDSRISPFLKRFPHTYKAHCAGHAYPPSHTQVRDEGTTCKVLASTRPVP